METDEKIRLSYLEAMGIQAWSLRLQSPGCEAGDAAALSPDAVTAEVLIETVADVSPDHQIPLPYPAKLPSEKGKDGRPQQKLDDRAVIKSPVIPIVSADLQQATTFNREAVQSAASAPPIAGTPRKLSQEKNLAVAQIGWDELQAHVAVCTACPLHQSRTQTVFGVGDRCADWMVIGEAPGEQEDLQGEPFVGRAGLLLNEMLRAIGLEREQVFIANILKCRPPKNRDPQVEEAAACEGYLKQQLALVKPKIILAVGRIAAQNLLKTTTPIGKLRGLIHDYQGVPLVVVYHPAYLLRSPLEKRRAFDDLRLALHTYRQTL